MTVARPPELLISCASSSMISMRRATRMTCTPSEASFLDIAEPIPPEAPVISAIFPCQSVINLITHKLVLIQTVTRLCIPGGLQSFLILQQPEHGFPDGLGQWSRFEAKFAAGLGIADGRVTNDRLDRILGETWFLTENAAVERGQAGSKHRQLFWVTPVRIW